MLLLFYMQSSAEFLFLWKVNYLSLNHRTFILLILISLLPLIIEISEHYLCLSQSLINHLLIKLFVTWQRRKIQDSPLDGKIKMLICYLLECSTYLLWINCVLNHLFELLSRLLTTSWLDLAYNQILIIEILTLFCQKPFVQLIFQNV